MFQNHLEVLLKWGGGGAGLPPAPQHTHLSFRFSSSGGRDAEL